MSVSRSPRNLVLIVEDKPSLASLYRAHIEAAGFSGELANSLETAISQLANPLIKVVILSLDAAGQNPLDTISQWSKTHPGIALVVIAANASIADAVDAVRAGAWDYLVKPVSRNRLVTTLTNACKAVPATKITVKSQAQIVESAPAATMIGSSRIMAETRRKIEAIAASSAPAFITGESGTGKELCAQAIHDFSSRKDKPFIALNCGAIPRDLMESEIFGHLKGAFTGAINDREGAASAANGGTLFLDEICEMDQSLQTKLLRFLQTGTIQPVGSAHTRKVNIRIICATNRTPQQEVAEGRFREDLYFRLHVLPIHLSPLRERAGDVIELATGFLKSYSAEEGRQFTRLCESAIKRFSDYSWPGNVRELQNVIRHSVVLNDAESLTADMLPDHIAAQEIKPAAIPHHIGRHLWQIERDVIEAAITSFAGSIPKAADALGISASTIYRKREIWTAKLN